LAAAEGLATADAEGLVARLTAGEGLGASATGLTSGLGEAVVTTAVAATGTGVGGGCVGAAGAAGAQAAQARHTSAEDHLAQSQRPHQRQTVARTSRLSLPVHLQNVDPHAVAAVAMPVPGAQVRLAIAGRICRADPNSVTARRRRLPGVLPRCPGVG